MAPRADYNGTLGPVTATDHTIAQCSSGVPDNETRHVNESGVVAVRSTRGCVFQVPRSWVRGHRMDALPSSLRAEAVRPALGLVKPQAPAARLD